MKVYVNIMATVNIQDEKLIAQLNNLDNLTSNKHLREVNDILRKLKQIQYCDTEIVGVYSEDNCPIIEC